MILLISGILCGLFALTASAQESSGWKTEETAPGNFQFYNDTGKFMGPQKAAIPISGPVIKIRKTFDLNALPAGLLKKASKASVRLYMAVYDFSWTKNPDKKSNGLTEEIVFRINGHDIILKTSDPRFPAKKGEKDPLHFRWVNVEFPLDWIADGKLVVEAFKNPSQTKDDYFYPAVDVNVPNRSSEISTNYGKSWSSKWGNLSDKSEYMLRLILDTTGVKKNIESLTSPDVSRSADLQNFNDLKLHDGASLSGGVLHFDGKKGYAVLPGTENWNIPPSGATFVTVVRFASSGNGMLIHKEGAFFLGRTGNRVNLSLCCDGKSWSEALVGGELPPPGKWIHLAAVIEPFSETAQGTGGYHLRVYLNGELLQQKKIGSLKTMLDKSRFPVEIGQALFKHEAYRLNGEIAEIGLYNRVMTDQEISRMAFNNPYVENKIPGMFPLTPSLEKSFAGLEKGTPFRKWTFASLRRAVENGFDPSKMETLLPVFAPLSGMTGKDADFIREWNRKQESFLLLDSGKGVLMLCIGNGQKNFPVAGFYNRVSKAPVFADRTMEWALTFRKNGREQQIESFDGSFQWQVSKPVMSAEGGSFRIEWSNVDFTVVSEAFFRDGRLEMNLKVRSRNPEVLLTQVHFPRWYFAHLPGTDDEVVYPHMSGIVVDNPMKNISMSGTYPSARVSMAFSAYYDKVKRNGIYFGFEDPLGRTKQYSVTGKLDKLCVDWVSPVAYPFGANGGNGYEMSGKAVLEAYCGDWFEAGQLYKKFVSEKAEWRHNERPRKDTPKWYRDNALWLLASAGKQQTREMLALAEYFDVPCAINWAFWYDFKKGDWPHHFENQEAAEGRAEFHKRGIKMRPYINGRLWGLKDGPDRKTDWMYSSHGARFAAKDENRKPYQEVYPYSVYSVMCPAASGWREHLLGEAGRTVGCGYDALYWDQVPCGLPLNCQDSSHGHPSNDPSLWLEQGYWQLFAELKKKFPDVAQDGEDISEPYLKYLDGAFVWRWLDSSHVPLFQSIYCGQVQFVARVFDPGDYQSYFSKMGEQAVYGEQLAGFLHINNMRYASPQRLYLKRMAHLRGALLYYFNEADMLRPLDFREKVPTISSDWGGKVYDAFGNGIVTTPKVVHSVWKRNDGRTMILFVNIVNETIALHPLLPFGKGKVLTVCRESEELPKSILLNGANLPALTLSPYKTEVWLLGERENPAEIKSIHEVLKKMNSFRGYGPMLAYPQNMSVRKKLTAESGKWINVLESSWMTRAFMPKFSCIGFRKTERWLQADKDAEVFFGEVDFGQGQGNLLELELAVDPPRAGGMVEMWIRAPGTKQEKCVAVLKTEPLGDWFDFKTVRVPLNTELKGKQEVILHFREKGCNLRGWRITR